MKKKLNRILFLVLVILFAVSSASMISVNAEGISLDDSLVVHWDFEGKTEVEIFADKAKGGNVNDNLTVDTDTTYITPFTRVSQICSWKDGTITNDIASKHPVLVPNGADIAAISDRSSTIILRFKIVIPPI